MYSKIERPLIAELCIENTSNEELLQLHQLHSQDQLPAHFSVQHGLVLYQNKFFLPKDSALITKVLTEFHASPQGGHTGVLKTLKRVAEQFFWFGMRKQVQDFVAACLICQQTKYIPAK